MFAENGVRENSNFDGMGPFLYALISIVCGISMRTSHRVFTCRTNNIIRRIIADVPRVKYAYQKNVILVFNVLATSVDCEFDENEFNLRLLKLTLFRMYTYRI